ncbi:hypothetical protein MJG53_005547 [Ovis ammon polii x Ovis aries]|uniref:Uncharacterized protein n=1 Tax=Ovis ammon polii x Ovis aries TaxID=2918886 RepID=A0ACB9VE96_9CETA|nr:hypothetical protein MJG53_005547 [Ovis ammon polii x Ovis aries]
MPVQYFSKSKCRVTGGGFQETGLALHTSAMEINLAARLVWTQWSQGKPRYDLKLSLPITPLCHPGLPGGALHPANGIKTFVSFAEKIAASFPRIEEAERDSGDRVFVPGGFLPTWRHPAHRWKDETASLALGRGAQCSLQGNPVSFMETADSMFGLEIEEKSLFWAQCAGPWLRLDISPSGAQLQTRRGRLQDSTVLRAPGDETLRSRRGLGPKHDIAKEQLSKTLALWSSVFSSAEDSLSSRRRWSLTHSLHDESENSATK